MLADHGGQLKTIQFRHADIDQDNGDVIFEQELQRLTSGGSLDQILAKLSKNHLVSQELVRLIVDQENVDLVVSAANVLHGNAYRCSHIRNAERSCSVFTGLAR